MVMAAQAQARDGLFDTATSVQITLAADHDPGAFFRTRSGLYVFDDFRRRVVTGAKRTNTGATFSATSARLKRAATDAEIEAALPPEHLFDASALCAIIAEMIAKQTNGESGDLDNSGKANLLYTSSCVVGVTWDGPYRKWVVYTRERGGRRWRAGRRVLSPAN